MAVFYRWRIRLRLREGNAPLETPLNKSYSNVRVRFTDAHHLQGQVTIPADIRERAGLPMPVGSNYDGKVVGCAGARDPKGQTRGAR